MKTAGVRTPGPQRIVVVGAGFAGLYTARRLQRRLRSGEASVTVIDRQPHMTYQPYLAEVAAGSIEARHVVLPLRWVLPDCRVLTGRVAGIDTARQRVELVAGGSEPVFVDYDQLVVATGALPRAVPVAGLAEIALPFCSVGQAMRVRDHVLTRLDLAAMDERARERMLTFVGIGGGFSGTELLAELHDMVRRALRSYPELNRARPRWILVEATDRILAELDARVGETTVTALRRRGIEVRLETTVQRVDSAGRLVLSDGEVIDAGTVVSAAGVRPSPLLAGFGLPVNPTGRLRCLPTLRVRGSANVWSAGDCAAVPDLTRAGPGADATCAPTAQHALRQARLLADNLIAQLRGRPTIDYRHAYAGSVAGLGLHRGAAEIYGIRMQGLLAWLVHRCYHVLMVPTMNRKLRVLGDWLLTSMIGRRELIALRPGTPGRPRRNGVGDDVA